MLFSGIPFLYYFLPLLIVVYLAAPKKLKNSVLFIFSLFFSLTKIAIFSKIDPLTREG